MIGCNWLVEVLWAKEARVFDPSDNKVNGTFLEMLSSPSLPLGLPQAYCKCVLRPLECLALLRNRIVPRDLPHDGHDTRVGGQYCAILHVSVRQIS